MAGGNEEERGLQLLNGGVLLDFIFSGAQQMGRKEEWYSRENFDKIIPTRKILEREGMCYCYSSNSSLLWCVRLSCADKESVLIVGGWSVVVGGAR